MKSDKERHPTRSLGRTGHGSAATWPWSVKRFCPSRQAAHLAGAECRSGEAARPRAWCSRHSPADHHHYYGQQTTTVTTRQNMKLRFTVDRGEALRQGLTSPRQSSKQPAARASVETSAPCSNTQTANGLAGKRVEPDLDCSPLPLPKDAGQMRMKGTNT